MAETSPYLRLEELLRLKRGGKLTFEQARELISVEMEQVADLRVPLSVDVGWGRDWQEAHT